MSSDVRESLQKGGETRSIRWRMGKEYPRLNLTLRCVVQRSLRARECLVYSP